MTGPGRTRSRYHYSVRAVAVALPFVLLLAGIVGYFMNALFGACVVGAAVVAWCAGVAFGAERQQ